MTIKFTEEEALKLCSKRSPEIAYISDACRKYICTQCRRKFRVPLGQMVYKLKVKEKTLVFHSHNCRYAYKLEHPNWNEE